MSHQLLPVMVGQGSGTLENEVEAALAALEKETIILAEADGRFNRPSLDESHLSPYVEPLHFGVQQILDKVEQALGFEHICQQVLHNRELAQVFTTDMNHQLVKLSQEALQVQAELNQLPEPPTRRRAILPWAAVITLSLMDGLLALPIALELLDSIIFAIPAVLVYSGTLVTLAHMLPKTVALGKTRWQKSGILLIWTVAMTTLFYWMASVREISHATSLDPTAADHTISGMTPWAFCLVSLVMFSASALVCLLYLPTSRQAQSYKRYRELSQRKKEIKKEQERLEAELKAFPRKQKEMEQDAGQIIHRGRMLEQRILTAAHRFLAQYKNANLRCRPDQGVPVSFHTPSTFTFTLYFTNIFNNLNHED